MTGQEENGDDMFAIPLNVSSNNCIKTKLWPKGMK